MKILNLSRILMLCAICATVLLSSCGKDDDNQADNRDNFVAVYSAVESCDGYSYTDSYDVTITAGADDDALIINNIYGVGVNGLNATVDGDNLTMPNQDFPVYAGVAATIEATGTLTGDVLTISFTISDGSQSAVCTLVCTKK